MFKFSKLTSLRQVFIMFINEIPIIICKSFDSDLGRRGCFFSVFIIIEKANLSASTRPYILNKLKLSRRDNQVLIIGEGDIRGKGKEGDIAVGRADIRAK